MADQAVLSSGHAALLTHNWLSSPDSVHSTHIIKNDEYHLKQTFEVAVNSKFVRV